MKQTLRTVPPTQRRFRGTRTEVRDEDWRVRSAREAAAVLVASMTTALWPAARVRMVLLLGAGDTVSQREIARRLEEARATLVAAPGDVAARWVVADSWREELAALARRDRHVGMRMRAFADAFGYLLEATAGEPSRGGS